MMSTNPYAAPKAKVEDAPHAVPAQPIWNPGAAASWSLPFSPAFGSYLHMLNWRALGEQEKAATAKAWFMASLALLPVYIALSMAALHGWQPADGISRALGIGFLVAWYFSAAKGQARYVKERFGKDYPRKPWGKALLIALGLMLAYVAVSFVVGFIAAPRPG
jgi:hypothetical protein